jgi:hypothetical protein
MSGNKTVLTDEPARRGPTPAQQAWLRRGLVQPGGKLPLFDENGRRVPISTIRRCLDAGWAEPLFSNPIKPDWLVCKLTNTGRALLVETESGRSNPKWPSIVRATQ